MACYKIVTLTYNQTYLQILMLNNGTTEIIYDSYDIIFFMTS